MLFFSSLSFSTVKDEDVSSAASLSTIANPVMFIVLRKDLTSDEEVVAGIVDNGQHFEGL